MDGSHQARSFATQSASVHRTAFFLAVCFVATARGAGPLHEANPSNEFVRHALRRELDERPEDRRKLLQQALHHDADCALARWHLGYVQRGASSELWT
jgi:hypothetical protein